MKAKMVILVHPNTYTSILTLAAFTFVVAALGTGAGMLIHRGAARISKRSPGPA